MKRRSASYGPKRRTLDAARATLVQMITYREDLSKTTAAALSRATGLSEAECAAALDRERLFREARRA